MEAIDPNELPKTLADAIEVTRQLGYQYLWIDSLCIIQDDEEDKPREISRMRQIFTYAIVVIVAASASNSNEGFLHFGNQLPTEIMHLPFPCPTGEIGTVHLWRDLDEFQYKTNQPIAERAWTLEEKLLSSRQLIYSNHLRFRCRSEDFSDGGECINTIGWETRLALPIWNSMSKENNYDELEFYSGFLQGNVWEVWYDIVEDYTSRQLTHPKDKMRAISGIVDAYSLNTDAKYLAGIWREQLVKGLLWLRKKSCPAKPRVDIYRAPSWSWGGIDGAVRHLQIRWAHDIQHFKVIECVVVPTAPSRPFGAISSGYLVLEGRLKMVSWATEDTNLYRLDDKERDDEYPFATIVQDVLEEHSEFVWCLEVFRSKNENKYGLILVPSEPMNNSYPTISEDEFFLKTVIFQRIGFWEHNSFGDVDYFSKNKVRQIRIV